MGIKLKIFAFIIISLNSLFSTEITSVTIKSLSNFNHFKLNDEIKTNILPDNSIYLAGSSINSNDSNQTANPYIGQFSIIGDIIWEKSLNQFPSFSAKDIIRNQNNEILVILNKNDNSEFKIILLNAEGTLKSCKTFNWPKNDIALEFSLSKEENISIIGKSNSLNSESYYRFFKMDISENGDSLSNSFFANFSVMKQYYYKDSTFLQIDDISQSFSKHGIQLFQRDIIYSINHIDNNDSTYQKYGKTYSDYWPFLEYGYNIYPASDSSLMILGCKGGYSSSRGLPFLLEIDNQGNEIFQDNRGISSLSNTEYYTQAFKISDGIILGAVAKSTNSIDANNSKLVIEKRDYSFQSIWTKEFDFTGKDYCYKVFELGKDSLLLIASNLREDTNVSFISIIDESSQNVKTSNNFSNSYKSDLHISYIAKNKNIKIQTNKSKFTNLTLSLVNLRGQVILSHKVNRLDTDIHINCKDISSGSYLVSINADGTHFNKMIFLK